jgi:hypothetical protein
MRLPISVKSGSVTRETIRPQAKHSWNSPVIRRLESALRWSRIANGTPTFGQRALR